MLLEVLHVLIDVDDLGVVLVDLLHEAFDELGKLGVSLVDGSLLALALATDVCKELFEVLGVVHDELVDDRLVKVD